MGGWRWWLMVGEGTSSPSEQFQDFCHLKGRRDRMSDRWGPIRERSLPTHRPSHKGTKPLTPQTPCCRLQPSRCPGDTLGAGVDEEREATHPWGHLAFLQCPPRGVLPGSQELTLTRICSRREGKLQLLKGQVPFSAVVLWDPGLELW